MFKEIDYKRILTSLSKNATSLSIYKNPDPWYFEMSTNSYGQQSMKKWYSWHLRGQTNFMQRKKSEVAFEG